MKKKLTALLLLGAMVLTMASCQSEDTPASTTAASPASTAATTTKAAEPDDPDLPETEEDIDMTDYCDLFIPYGTATVDGVKDDSWANAATVTLDLTKKDVPADDTEVSASAMWDNNALYFLFEITDSDIYQSGTLGDFNIDGIYLYVSENPEVYLTSFDQFNNGVYQFALINKDLEMIPRRGLSYEIESAESAYTLTETGMIIEFCYTPTIVPLAAGNFMLIDYQYNDAGSTGTRKGALGWYNGTDDNAVTNNWGYAKLLAEGESAPNS